MGKGGGGIKEEVEERGGRKEEKELQRERKEDSQSAHLFSLPESICIHRNI